MDKAKKLSEMFEELANPVNGYSEWINLQDLPKKYEILTSGKNGNRVNRKTSLLHEKYNVEPKYADTQGRPLLALRLNGFKK